MSIFRLFQKIIKLAKNAWIMRIYFIFLCIFAFFYFYKHKENLFLFQRIFQPEILFPLILLNYLTFFFFVYIHFSTYRKQGVKVSYWQVFKIVALSRCGVYLPGKLMFGLNYYIFSRLVHIETDKIGKNFVINNAFLLLTGVLCSLFVIAEVHAFAKIGLIILFSVSLIIIHPKILNMIFSKLLSMLKKNPLAYKTNATVNGDYSWSYKQYMKFMGFYLLHWAGVAVRLYLYIHIFSNLKIIHFPLIISAAALSEIIGLLAFFAPAGIGVKEGIGVVLLSQIAPWNIVLLSFLALRIFRMFVDVPAGLVSAASFTKEKKKALHLRDSRI